MSTTNLAADNFLIPNATILVELVIFLITLFIMWKFVVPPVRKAMADRNEMVQRTIEESRRAEERFREAETRYRDALADARGEAGKIRDGARSEGQKVLDEFRERAGAEVARLRQRGNEQLTAQREQVLSDLEPHVSELASALATKVVGAPVGGKN